MSASCSYPAFPILTPQAGRTNTLHVVDSLRQLCYAYQTAEHEAVDRCEGSAC
jgi:hypothetical protein